MNIFTETLCRACLHVLAEDLLEEDTKHNLYSTPDLLQKFQACTCLNAEPKDELPENLCEDCFQKVNKLYTFRMMCIDAVPIFHEMLQSHQLNREKLSMELPFDDEKQVFDVNRKTELEITIEEPMLLEPVQASEDFHTNVKNNKPLRRGRKAKNRSTNSDSTKKASTRKIAKESNNLQEKGGKMSTELVEEKHIDISNVIAFDNVEDSDEELSLATLSKKECTANSIKLNTSVSKRKCRARVVNKSISTFTPNTTDSNKSNIFQCDICPTRFFVEHRLIAHKRHHAGLVPYPCPRDDCDKSFNRWHCLSEHLKQHEGINKTYTCEVAGCGKSYKHKPTLIMHLRKRHKLGPEIRSHICEICGKVFKSAPILNDHRYTHKDKSELPYACDQPECNRRFSKREKLKVHLMRHAGIKNFVCPYCGMRKTTRNELKIHINYHTLERTWPCRFCSHVCNSAGNLKMHVRTVHERAKDYECSYCQRTFAKPDTKKYHEMTHTGEKPHQCKECGKRFTQPAALRTHKKIHLRQRIPSSSAPTAETEEHKIESSLISAENTLISNMSNITNVESNIVNLLAEGT